MTVDETSLRRARRRLLRRSLAKSTGQLSRRTRPRVLAGGIALTLTLGAILAVALVLSPGPQGATPAAAEVLNRAAQTSASAPTVGPDQYLHVTSKTTSADGSVYVQDAWIPGDAARMVVITDSEDTWTTRVRSPSAVADPEATTQDVYEWLARDNGDLSGDEAAFERLGETLTDTGTPETIRARLFDAATLIDGVEVVDDDQLEGMEVILLARNDADTGYATQLAFDRFTGRFVCFRGVRPDGTVDYTTRRS